MAEMRSKTTLRSGIRANTVLVCAPVANVGIVATSAGFDDALTMGEGEALIERIEARPREEFTESSSIYIRPERSEDAPLASARGKASEQEPTRDIVNLSEADKSGRPGR